MHYPSSDQATGTGLRETTTTYCLERVGCSTQSLPTTSMEERGGFDRTSAQKK